MHRIREPGHLNEDTVQSKFVFLFLRKEVDGILINL